MFSISRYADNTTLNSRKWRGTKEPPDESERGECKADLNLKKKKKKNNKKHSFKKTKIMACSSITSWQIEGGKVKAVTDFLFLGSKMTTDSDCSHEIKRCLVLGRKAVTNLVQFSSVTPSCPTLCDPMNRSTPGLPVCHQLPEFTQTHVHWVSDAIQPSHPLSSPSPPAFNLSQHEGLFQWVSSLHQVAKILEENMLLQPLRVSAPHLQEAGTDRFLCPFPLSNNILLK